MITALLLWFVLLLSGDLARIDLDERAFERMMVKAKVFARFPGLPEAIADNPEAVAGIMLSLRAYGLEPTLPAIKMAFHWIEGKAEPSARLYVALAWHHGYILRPLVRERDRAVARIKTPAGEESDWEYNLEDALDAHRLDEWVERWEKNGEKWRKTATLVFKVNGEDVVDQLPEWATRQIEDGRAKRYEAWWSYRKHMMWKSAAKAAVDGQAAHLLLGATWLAEDRLPERRDFIDVEPVHVHPSQPAGPGQPADQGSTRPAGDTLFEEGDDGRPFE